MIITDKYDATYYEHLCDFCGNPNELHEIDEKEICEECIIKIFGKEYFENMYI